MASMRWKSAEILKVFGTTIKEGTFTGSKATAQGTITKDKPTTFTPEYISKVYENIKTHVPIVIDHKAGDNEVVGYAFKVGITDTHDDLKYSGFIFSKDAMDKITMGGYSRVSPEIDDKYDPVTGELLDARLERIAFVQNPAITGTEADAEHVVFSKGDNMTEGNATEGNAGETATAQTTTQTTDKPTQVVEHQEIVTPDRGFGKLGSKNSGEGNVAGDVAELSTKMNEYKTTSEHLAAKVDQLLTERYEGIVAELKGQGIEDPGKIVHGLPVEQKITVLSKMKETVVKTKPLATTPVSTGGSDGGSQSTNTGDIPKAVNEVLAELGYTPEEYKALRGD